MKVSNSDAIKLIHEGTLVLSRIEANGVRIDKRYLTGVIGDIQKRIAAIHDEMKTDPIWGKWERKSGVSASITSRPQLGNLLFKEMGYKVHDYTEKSKDTEFKKAKTDKTALERIKIPFVKNFLKVEGLRKLLSTYLEGLDRESVQASDGCWYIHPMYDLNVASTYRSTSRLPNFQNVPKRNEEMSKLIRRAYLPHPGHHLVEIDFSTLEVRIAYAYHKDPVMEKYLTDKSTDMHRDTAMELFMLKQDQVEKKTTRDSAKNMFVFPEFYGSVYFQCAKNIWESMKRGKWQLPGSETLIKDYLKTKGVKSLGECDPQREPVKGTFEYHVQQVEKKLWKRFSVYRDWKRSWFDKYQKSGSFQMFTGFVVNTGLKRNEVINYPVQGSAFHCLLWSLIELQKWLDKYKMKSKLIGQIHDSMVCSVHPKELQAFLHRAHWIMTYLLPRAWKWISIGMESESDVSPVDKPWSEQNQYIEDDGEWVVKL